MKERTMPYLAICIVASFFGASGIAHAADPACQPVFEAMTKLASTPNHMFMTTTAAYNSGPETGETITTADAMYVKDDTSWQKRPYNSQQEATAMRQAYKTSNMVCQHLRDDSVAGEPVAIYNTQDKQEDGTTVNSQLWISMKRGVPLKQTMEMDVGGKVGKSHDEMRYDYSNVQAPARVN